MITALVVTAKMPSGDTVVLYTEYDGKRPLISQAVEAAQRINTDLVVTNAQLRMDFPSDGTPAFSDD
jgi:hypothetical protein